MQHCATTIRNTAVVSRGSPSSPIEKKEKGNMLPKRRSKRERRKSRKSRKRMRKKEGKEKDSI